VSGGYGPLVYKKPDEAGFDLNRWTWNRKRKHWQRPMHIVTPSHWLANCVRESELMRDWPVSIVPNPIDTDRWKPMYQTTARSLLGLPVDAPLLLFGAMGGGRDPRKGFDLLLDALAHLRAEREDLHLVVFGQLAPREPPDLGFTIHYTGHLNDDLSLRALYSAADVLVMSARQGDPGECIRL
jgi:glycosyltransferase involved in cell wall biosynthesis